MLFIILHMEWYDNNDDFVAVFLKFLEVYSKMIWIKNHVVVLTRYKPIHSCSVQEHRNYFGATFCSKYFLHIFVGGKLNTTLSNIVSIGT